MPEEPRIFESPRITGPGEIRKRDLFIQECERQMLQPLAGDERVAAFARGARYAAEVNPIFLAELEDVFVMRPDEPVAYTFSRFLRAVQKGLISEEAAGVFNYPEEFDMQNWMNWSHGIEWILAHPDLSSEFTIDVLTRELQSNITQRYVNIKLLQLLLPGTIRSGPSVLDIGCSQNQGLKKLFLQRPFMDLSIMRESITPDDPEQSEKGKLSIDEKRSHIVNCLLDSNIRIGASVGIDVEPLYDPLVKKWAAACTFLPTERLDQNLRAEFADIDEREVRGVGFKEADFLKLGRNTPETERIGHRSFDLLFYSTVIYQGSPTERKAMLVIGNKFRKRKGMRVILDNAIKDSSEPSGLRFNPDYTEMYGYRTHIDDPLGGDELLEVFQWENGRCLKLKAGNDIGRLALVPGVNIELLEAIAA